MTILLCCIIVLCVVVITALFMYVDKTESGNLKRDMSLENPLSIHNIHSTKQTMTVYTKEFLRKIYLLLLRITLRLKKFTRIILDRAIRKLSRLAFPEQKSTALLEENHILNNTEEYKKNRTPGTIE